MATLTIRNLPQDVHDRLRLRAAAHRRSMEAEARDMLTQELSPEDRESDRRAAIHELQEMGREWLAKVKPPQGWSFVDQDVAERRLEGAWEDGRVSDEERRRWLLQLNAFQVWPAELEAFLASRRP